MKFKMIIAVLALGMFFFTSCREKETTVILETKTTTKTETEAGALERAAKKVDAEVNKKIDKTIDKIGNDN